VPPAYRFLDRWLIPAPIDRVYEALGDPLGYENWWTEFVIRSTGDAGEPRPGKKNELLVKAYLPYKVNFGLEVLRRSGRGASFRDSRRTSTEQASGRCKRPPRARRRTSTGARRSTTR
jgi:hypothetical protein